MSTEEKRVVALLDQFRSPLAVERDGALQALADFIHQPAVQQVVREASDNDPDPDVRYRARQLYATAASYFKKPAHSDVVSYLKHFQETKQVDLNRLKSLLAQDDPAIRLQAVVVTLQMQGDGLIETLLPYFDTETDPWVLAGIVAAIGKFGNANQLASVAKLFSHQSPRVVANAVSAAYTLDRESAFPLVAPLLAHRDHRVLANVLVILSDRDKERYIGHLRLMASSRKEALRASAIYCMRQAPLDQVEDILLDMFMTERLPGLIEKQASLLGDIASPGAVPSLIRLAGTRSEKDGPVRSILAKMAERLQWTPEVLADHLAKIEDTAKSVAANPPVIAKRPSGQIPIVVPQVQRSYVPHFLFATGVLGIASVITFSNTVEEKRAGIAKPGVATTKRPVPVTSKNDPSSIIGKTQTITGQATILGKQSLVMKEGYTFYLFDFQDKNVLRTVDNNQQLCVQGKYLGWDEDVGAVRMAGESVTEAGGTNAKN